MQNQHKRALDEGTDLLARLREALTARPELDAVAADRAEVARFRATVAADPQLGDYEQLYAFLSRRVAAAALPPRRVWAAFVQRQRAGERERKRRRGAALKAQYATDNERRSEESVARWNKRYVCVEQGADFFVAEKKTDRALGVPQFVFWAPKKFVAAKKNQRVELLEPDGSLAAVPFAGKWLGHESRRQVDGVVYLPGEPPYDPEDDKVTFLNLWQGWQVAPRAGTWAKFRRFVFDIVSNRDLELFEFVLDALAMMYQKPGELWEIAMWLFGEQGVGKSTFVECLGLPFGRGLHFLVATSPNHVSGRFNAHLHDTSLLFADETFFSGDHGAVSAVKNLVRQPVLSVEHKGREIIHVKSSMHLIGATNEHMAAKFEASERKHFPLYLSSDQIDNAAYFAPIRREMFDDGGAGAMLHDLQQRDISAWRPREWPAASKPVVWEQKQLCLDQTAQFLLSALKAGAFPDGVSIQVGAPTEVPKDDVFSWFCASRFGQANGFERKSDALFWKKLRAYLKGEDVLQEKRARFGAVRQSVMRFAPLAELRAAFACAHRSSVEIIFGDAPAKRDDTAES
jgi:hypothetical protein